MSIIANVIYIIDYKAIIKYVGYIVGNKVATYKNHIFFIYFNMSFSEGYNNGIFNNTVLFCENDDIFCPYINSERIHIRRYDVSNFLNTYNKYRNNNNIIIDSRLTECIIYGILYFDNDLLIYNVVNNQCENIFEYAKITFQMNTTNLNIGSIKKLVFLYIFINYYLKDIDQISWNNNTANKCIFTNSSNDIITLDYIVDYINIPTSSTTKDITKMTKYIKDIIEFKNLNTIKPLPRTLTTNDIQITLKNMITLGLMIKTPTML